MNNNNKDTARYLVSLFLNSKYSLKYDSLTGNYCGILRYMYDQMDRKYKACATKECDQSQKQISIYSRCSIRTVGNAISYFIKKRMLKEEKVIGNPSRFKPGKLLTAYATIAYRVRKEKQEVSNGCVSSNSSSNSFSKNKRKASSFVSQKSKDEMQREKENAVKFDESKRAPMPDELRNKMNQMKIRANAIKKSV